MLFSLCVPAWLNQKISIYQQTNVILIAIQPQGKLITKRYSLLFDTGHNCVILFGASRVQNFYKEA